MSKPGAKEAIPQEVLALLQDSKIGYLSVTSSKGELYSYPVAFHYGEGKIYLITPAGKVTEGEKKLLKKWKAGAG